MHYGHKPIIRQTNPKEEHEYENCSFVNGEHIGKQADLRFGRAGSFIIVETDTMEYAAIDNAGTAASGGAGISAAQMVERRMLRQ